MNDLDPATLQTHDHALRRLARSLAGDSHSADDLVQDTWAAALVTSTHPRSAIAWLRGVMYKLATRSARTAARRRRREIEASVGESIPGVAEALARESERRRVVDALTALPEPYRATLVLRYLEDMTPGDIARHSGEPVETVRTRIKRGLDLLRRRFCGRGAGLLLFGLERSVIGLSALSILTMATKTKIVTAVAVALLVSGSVWMTMRGSPEQSPSGALPSAGPTGPRSVSVPSADVTEPPASNDRSPVALPDAGTAETPLGARLVVEVRWQDQSPAVGLSIDLQLPETWGDDPRTSVTDEHGLAIFDEVAAGRYHVQSDGRAQQAIKAEVGAPGTETRVVLTIPDRAFVNGRVIDTHSQPVAGADVIATSWAGDGRSWRVATSDVAGGFSVRAVGEGTWIGARHPRFVPSVMQVVFAKTGAEVEMTLQLGEIGSTLSGTVRDADGAPVEGAMVFAGVHVNALTELLPDGTRAMPSAPPRLRSDAQGRFVIPGLAPGPRTVFVRAKDFAIWIGEVDIEAGGARDLEIRLGRGGYVVGRFTTAGGVPLAKVRLDVRMSQLGQFFRLVRATSDADGNYRLGPLPTGVIPIRAYTEDGASAKHDPTIEEGVELRWDHEFTAGRVLRGRVVDRHGEPVEKAWIEARGASWSGHETTDADGRFAMEGVSVDEIDVTVRFGGFAMLQQHATLREATNELNLQLDLDSHAMASIRGRVVDTHGEAVVGANVNSYRANPPRSGSGIDSVDAKTGAFEIARCPPGTYKLTIECAGIGMARISRTVAAMEVCDLGDIVLQAPARIAVKVSDGGAPPHDPKTRAVVCDLDGVFLAPIKLLDGGGLSAGLAPGNYRVIVRAEGRAIAHTEVALEAGTTQDTQLALASGTMVRISMPRETHGSIELRDAENVTIDWLYRSRDEDAEETVCLLPGTYSLNPTAGRAHRFTVTVGTTELRVDVPGW